MRFKKYCCLALWLLATSASAHGPGTAYQDCEYCPPLIEIAPGTFRMGTPAGVDIDNETGAISMRGGQYSQS